MQNPNELRLQKMMNQLIKLPMSQEELDHVEAYLEEGGQEHLDSLTYRDLSGTDSETCKNFQYLFREFSNKGRTQEYTRLFEVVFRLGQSTCFILYPMELLRYKSNSQDQLNPVHVCSVFAEQICAEQHYLSSYWFERLLELSGKNPDVIRAAFDCHKAEYDNGLLVLQAAYLHLKYRGVKQKSGILAGPEQDGPEKTEQRGGILKNIARLLKGESAPAALPDPADQQLLERHENSIASSIRNLFQKKLPDHAVEYMEKYVKQSQDQPVPPQLANLARGYAMGTYLTYLLCGCAFINFELSPRLRNFLRLCAVRGDDLLAALERFDVDSKLMGRWGGSLDQIFGIDQKSCIFWAAKKNHGNILAAQFKENPELFTDCLNRADANGFQAMMRVIRANDKAMFDKISRDSLAPQQEKAIQNIIPAGTNGQMELCEYLRGNKPLEDIYIFAEDLGKNSRYAWQERNIMNQYRDTYGKDDFYIRCLIVMIFKKAAYFLSTELSAKQNGTQPDEAVIIKLFRRLDQAGLSLSYQLQCVELAYEYAYTDTYKGQISQAAIKVFGAYLEQRPEETTQAFRNAGATGRCIGVKTLGRRPENQKVELLAYSGDSSKVVKEALTEILRGQPGWKTEVAGLLKSKKAAQRELAVQVLRGWNDADSRKLLEEALAVEKSSKLAALLRDVLNLAPAGADVAAVAATPDEKVKELHKGGKKRTLAWAYATPFVTVHKKDHTEAGEEYLQAILLCYATMSVPGVSKDAVWLAEQLEADELAAYVSELFDKWLEAGAESKKKWVLYASAIHGGSGIVEKLKHQINEWPQHARGAIAAEAVKALALNNSPAALLTVDAISRKFKFRQIKTAAGAALEFAASQLGLTRDELEDKIVPDLGFNEQMERIFDYGSRKFKVYLTQNLELEVFDENDKKLKNLPAPGKKDDPELAVKENQAFKEMKKQMKTTVANQKLRLEQALSVERKWNMENWQALFVKNPVMHQFAIGLIWGVYVDGTLLQTFRYMEDGTFNTEEEEEYTLPEQCAIGLVHPIELSEELRKTWEEQLSDYEVVQPLEQLKRPVNRLQPEEQGQRQLERFGGCILNGLSLSGKLQSQGWYRGSVQDAGCYYTFYREDQALGLGVELHFSGMFVGGENEEVTVYGARFYQAGTIKRGSYMYDEVKEETAVPLKDVPPRYFSEIVLQLTRATASSQEKNENWKKGE